jgi:hypothetical protein
LGHLSYGGCFVSIHTRYPDYQNEQETVAVLLRSGCASASRDMRSSMFAAYYLAGTGVQDLIAAVGRTKMIGNTVSTHEYWFQFHA